MNCVVRYAAAAAALAVTVLAAPGWAAGPTASQAETNYQLERGRCLSGPVAAAATTPVPTSTTRS